MLESNLYEILVTGPNADGEECHFAYLFEYQGERPLLEAFKAAAAGWLRRQIAEHGHITFDVYWQDIGDLPEDILATYGLRRVEAPYDNVEVTYGELVVPDELYPEEPDGKA